MYRAFQTAMVVHKPDVVFVLGEFLIKFGNLNHIVTGVVVLGWALESPLALASMLIFYFKTVDFDI